MRPLAGRLRAWVRHRVGYRGLALLFFALVDIVYAISLATLPPETSLQPAFVFLARVAPLPVWAAVWALVGVVCLGGAFAERDRVAFAFASLLKVAWGCLHLAAFVVGEIPRGYVSAVVWLAFAAFVHLIAVWPEPPRRM